MSRARVLAKGERLSWPLEGAILRGGASISSPHSSVRARHPRTIEAGVSRLSVDGRRQIVDAYASRYPDDWRELVVDAGGTETAEESAVVGALRAALREARTPDQLALDLLDDDGDAAEELALAIDATNLWSIDESAGLDEVLASLGPDLDDNVYEVLWAAAVDRVAERL